LLETERRLEDRLLAARAEAVDIVAQAQEAADREAAALEAHLTEAARLLDQRLAAEGRRRAAAIAEAADREAQAYERVAAARLTAIAQTLAKRFLVGGAA